MAAEGLAHSGTGYNRSNCCRSRFVYSFPFTRSSDSVSRSLRSLGFEAKDTVIRSSSLSIHAGAWPLGDVLCSSSEVRASSRSVLGMADGAESTKKS